MKLFRHHPLTLALWAPFTPDKGGEGLSPPAGRGETRATRGKPDGSRTPDRRYCITGIENCAPSFTPDGQRWVTVLVLV